jgi:hypothetical protein
MANEGFKVRGERFSLQLVEMEIGLLEISLDREIYELVVEVYIPALVGFLLCLAPPLLAPLSHLNISCSIFSLSFIFNHWMGGLRCYHHNKIPNNIYRKTSLMPFQNFKFSKCHFKTLTLSNVTLK